VAVVLRGERAEHRAAGHRGSGGARRTARDHRLRAPAAAIPVRAHGRSSQVSAPTRIRIGIVGLGLITQSRHIPNLARLSDVFEIVHVCDLSAEVARGIAEQWPSAAWTTDDADVLSDPDVDAVLICTPGAHSAIARRALESGK